MYKGWALRCVMLVIALIAVSSSYAKDSKKGSRTGSLYLSWGYNTAWYSKSTVGIKQPSLGNDYKMMNVLSHDHRGWDEHILHQQLTIPQYNYRLGYYFNDKQDLAFELNFDHVKYIIQGEQDIRIQGTMANAAIDTHIFFSRGAGFYYFLNNGANFFCFNIVKRKQLYSTKDRKFYLDFLGKAGAGPVIPHVENSLFGQANKPQFQFGGWNAGLETALRATFMRYAYLEFCQKVDYARYSHLLVYQGRARQAFSTYELVLSLGAMIPTTRKKPLFERMPTADGPENKQ